MPEDYEALAIAAGWYWDNEDQVWRALDVLGPETEIPGPFKTAKECCDFDKIIPVKSQEK